ncbi:MAG: MFS transporter [Alphaproteobacteria bacterium]
MIRLPLLRDADFRRLLAGAAFNQQGMTGEHVIIGLLVLRITDSTAWVGITLAVYFLPFFVFGMLSGVVADWIDRRKLLRGIEIALIVNLLLFALCLVLDFTALWLLISFTLVSGSLRAMHQPVRASYAYDITGPQQVTAAIGFVNLGSRSGQLVGALAAGAIMHRYGAPTALLAVAAGHGLAFLLFSGFRTAGAAAETVRAPIRQNLREYAAELGSNRILVMLLAVTASIEIFGFSFATTLPELAVVRSTLGADGLGLMHAARASGGIAAGLAFSLAGAIQHRGIIFLCVIVGFGACLMLLSVDSPLLLTLLAIFMVTTMATSSDILTQSMMQLSVANHLRGRAMGVWVLAIGAAPLGHLQMGAFADWAGVGNALLVNGAALVATGLVTALAVPALRRL